MTPRRQRLLRRGSALLIAVTLLGTLAAAAVLPLADAWSAVSQASERSARLLAGYQRVIDTKALEDPRLEDLRRQDAGRTDVIGGATGALAFASLQTEVKQMVEAHGAKIQSLQPGAITPSHHLERVELKLDFSIPGAGLAGLLEDLDRHRPSLLIDPIELQATDGNQRTDVLTVRMTVGAYRWPAAS